MSLITRNDCQTLDATNTMAGLRSGIGLPTTWRLHGSTEAYSGTFNTDGYKVTAEFEWLPDISNYSDSMSNYGIKNVIGTCVETLNDDGTSFAAGASTGGNHALCHWIYFESDYKYVW